MLEGMERLEVVINGNIEMRRLSESTTSNKKISAVFEKTEKVGTGFVTMLVEVSDIPCRDAYKVGDALSSMESEIANIEFKNEAFRVAD